MITTTKGKIGGHNLTSNKAEFRPKGITEDEEGHFIMLRSSFHSGDGLIILFIFCSFEVLLTCETSLFPELSGFSNDK